MMMSLVHYFLEGTNLTSDRSNLIAAIILSPIVCVLFYVCIYVCDVHCLLYHCHVLSKIMNMNCFVIVALAPTIKVVKNYVASSCHDTRVLLYGCSLLQLLMSSCKSQPSQPQLLSPKFFEQPPKLLPPSIFRQACEAAADGECTGSKSAIDESSSKPFQSQHEIARDHEGAPAQSQTTGDRSEPTRKLSAGVNKSVVKSKKDIQLHPSDSVSRFGLCPADETEHKIDQQTFNPKCDNQLLLVTENVSYTLAAKNRWKKSDHLAVVSGSTSSGGKKLDKVLLYSAVGASARSDPASTKGQLALALGPPEVDTPTCFVSAAVPPASFSEFTSTKPVSCPDSAHSKSTKRPVTESVSSKKNLGVLHDVGVNVDLPTEQNISNSSKASFVVGDRTTLCFRTIQEPQVTFSYSSPVSSAVPGTDRFTRNNFDEVYGGFAGEQYTTDNLRPGHEESPPTKLNTRLQKPQVCRDHTDLKTKASHPQVDVGNSASSVALLTRMASVVDTESDLVLAQVLQSEEYGVPGERVVRKEERTKPQRVAMDCSSDFEIARRLQQELDAEIAQSMQSQEDHHRDYRRIPGSGRRLGRCCNLFKILHSDRVKYSGGSSGRTFCHLRTFNSWQPIYLVYIEGALALFLHEGAGDTYWILL